MRLMPSPRISASQVISGQLDAGRIPALDASKVTTGTLSLARIPALDAGRIPALDASKVTTGTLSLAQIPALDAGRIPGLDASKIVSGLISGERMVIPYQAVGYEMLVSSSQFYDLGQVVSGSVFGDSVLGGGDGGSPGFYTAEYVGGFNVPGKSGSVLPGSWQVIGRRKGTGSYSAHVVRRVA